MTFHDFSLEPKLLDGLDAMGFETPTPIQEQAIPIILQNKDLIACAQTGTGKTAAYVLPVLNNILTESSTKLNTLIIAPTRELALQIDQQIEGFGYFVGVSSISVYGGGDGAAFSQQQKAMREGADIIVATPGRLIALLTSAGSVDMSSLKHLILDEADRMLDMGFYEDIMRIISYLPKNRQTLLFSATMPPRIRQMAAAILNQPEQINIAISKPAEGIDQQAYLVYDDQKIELLKHILKQNEYKRIILFASTKDKVKELNAQFNKIGIATQAFHSDLEQSEREAIMLAYRNMQVRMLVGTDILSRGIDIDGIDLVVNLDVPPDPEDYIHRIGRTARAESTGTAITFVNIKDQSRFYEIENLIGKDIPKIELPENMGKGPAYEPLKKPNTNKFKNKGKSDKKSFHKNKKFSHKNNSNRPKND